jgi:hypothetical protein
MAIVLKQSTASQEIPLGHFLDSVDGNTEKNGLTIANTDIKLWKMGATTLANKNSGGATNISNGVYYCTLDATDTDTLGGLVIFVHVATALAVKVECEVVTANVYDALIAGTDLLDVQATLTGTEQNGIADALLKRDWTLVTGEAARSVLNALRFLRNKWSILGGTLTVTEEDDATPAWTAAVTTSPTDPVDSIDPT